MAHLTARSGYESLVDRLNQAPQGAPPSELLYAILKMLFSEEEAGLVALLPIKPFTVGKAAAVWKEISFDSPLSILAWAVGGFFFGTHLIRAATKQ